jgi:GDPmannose 4,6-dehydratase
LRRASDAPRTDAGADPTMQKQALITGITGQDGAYLAQLLLAQGYRVFGTYRRTSSVNFWRLEELGIAQHPALELVEFDLIDASGTIRLLQRIGVGEIYNLAAQSFVGVSFEQPIATAQITAIGALNLLEAIRIVDRNIRFYQASTSEMFGLVRETPQRESTPFHPRSPYGFSKLFAHWATVNYRESYGLFAVSGILFNHESPLRGKEFVTRKITDAVARIKLGQLEGIDLGNLDARRDWGFAGEYVRGMHAMLQTDTPDDFVLATGRTESVRRFAELSFKAAGIELRWSGHGVDEIGTEVDTGKIRVRVNPKFYRPAEVDVLTGDASHAAQVLGWTPQTTLEELCRTMVEADLRRVSRGFSW